PKKLLKYFTPLSAVVAESTKLSYLSKDTLLENGSSESVGMEGPLVDAEGFPRADVNVYQIRTAKHSISCLQNYHKAIMVEIEMALHRLHAREKAKRDQDQAESQAESMEQEVTLVVLFSVVRNVSFGSVNARNFQNLQNIASVVQHSEGKPLSVTLIRNGQKTQMGLTPLQWSGRGLLG
uniref:26S proteasome non-ATPase regulatory subunit 9 n=1 Tax=Salmo trutta TaxID=8032 RepID=A0A674CSY5_SALTR